MKASIRTSLATVLLAAILVVGPGTGAEAAVANVTGTTLTTSPGTCGDPVLTGVVARIECVGLQETWAGDISGTAVFDETVTINLVSGRVGVAGNAAFVGSIAAASGTLELAYQGSGRIDLQTFSVIFIEGEERITAGAGGLAGAHGSIRFSLIGEDPAPYEGVIVL